MRALARAAAELQRRRQDREDQAEQRRAVVLKAHPVLKELLDQHAEQCYEVLILAAQGADEERRMACRQKQTELSTAIESYCKGKNLPAHLNFYEPGCPHCGDRGYVQGRPCVCLLSLAAQMGEDRKLYQAPAAFTFEQDRPELFPDDVQADYFGGRVSPRRMHAGLVQILRDYAEQFSVRETRNLLLFGPPGTGKTFLLAALATAVQQRGFAVAFLRMQELLELYQEKQIQQQRYQVPPEEREQLVERLNLVESAELLLLDDLGSERPSEMAYQILLDLFNERLNGRRPLILTTNLEPQDIERLYDPRLSSRILGSFERLPVKGPDLRRLLFERHRA